MKNNTYKLICLDLDGTLLNSKHKISRETMMVLQRLEDRGVTIAIVTGRPAYDAKKHAQMISQNAYYIGSNGAIVGHGTSDALIAEKALSKGHLKTLMEIAHTLKLKPILFTADHIYINGLRDFLLHLYYGIMTGLDRYDRIRYVPSKRQLNQIGQHLEQAFYKAIFFVPNRRKLRHIEPILRAHQAFEMALTSDVCVEITERNMNKSQGVRRLAEHLGIEQSQIVAFGDSENDVEMLKYVGLGVAMGNGGSHVKAIADQITQSNDEEGVAVTLKQLFGV